MSRLQIYLVAYVAVALLVSLWVLPGTGRGAHADSRPGHSCASRTTRSLTAFIAGDLFIVLPGLTQASRTLLDRLDPGNGEPAGSPT